MNKILCVLAGLLGLMTFAAFWAGWHAAADMDGTTTATSTNGSGGTLIACALVAAGLMWTWRRVFPATA